MLNFKEFITELFDNHYDYKKHEDPDNELHIASFHHNGEKYGVMIMHSKLKDKTHDASVSFGRGDHMDSSLAGNSGHNSHRVFSTVKKIVDDHIKAHPEVSNISFTSSKDDGNSRTKLYRHLVSKYSKNNFKEKSHDFGSEFNIPVDKK